MANVTYVQGDAQVHPFDEKAFDIAMSSFGAMFFGDPVAAFTNIGNAVRPGGRLALLAWRELARNEWLMALREALAVGRQLPMPPPDAPTPFALADPERVRGILGAAGYEEIGFEPIDEPIEFGSDADDAFAFMRNARHRRRPDAGPRRCRSRPGAGRAAEDGGRARQRRRRAVRHVRHG